MPSPYAPDSLDVGNQIVSYLTNLKYADNVTPVYTAGQLGRYKDLSDLLPANGTNAVFEVYGHKYGQVRYAVGGRMKTPQSFFVLSLVDITNANTAEQTILNIADRVAVVFAAHVQLGGTSNTLLAKINPNGMFLNVPRAPSKEYRGYLCELDITQEWTSQGGFVQ